MKRVLLFAFLWPPFFALAEEPLVVPLWEKGAPGFEERRHEPEQAKDYWVRNIHNPSITVFPAPKEKANGAAVLICPGGGHRLLVYKAEGVEPAQYLNDLGVTCFVLKYRLARETNSPYSLQIHPRQDAQRAMRLIRSRAKFQRRLKDRHSGLGGALMELYYCLPDNAKNKSQKGKVFGRRLSSRQQPNNNRTKRPDRYSRTGSQCGKRLSHLFSLSGHRI